MNKCPKCQGEMEQDILAKPMPYLGIITWATKLVSGFFSSKLENKKDIVVYRCKNCGYLESYAK